MRGIRIELYELLPGASYFALQSCTSKTSLKLTGDILTFNSRLISVLNEILNVTPVYKGALSVNVPVNSLHHHQQKIRS